jgi:hypothetical protein
MKRFPMALLVLGLMVLWPEAAAAQTLEQLQQFCRAIITSIPAISEFPFADFFNRVVSPLALAIGGANLLLAAPFVNVIRLLQGFLLEPALLLFGRRRKAFGTVFDSLSKKPVDLAVVRLIDDTTGRIKATRVTDQLGRFSFFVGPGRYRFSVEKKGYLYPSHFLAGEKYDINFGEIITGGAILMKQTGTIDINLPVDGPEDRLTTAAAFRRKFKQSSHGFFAYFGILLSAVAVIFAWSTLTWALFVGHLLLFLIFIRLTRKPLGRPWGRVFDSGARTNLERAVVRIVDTRFNRVLETLVTDRSGQYGFLVGRNQYRLESLRPGYEHYRGTAFTPRSRPAVVSKDIGMHRQATLGPQV